MPLWRCPHCATPQAEASRCWVCHRSTTSCVTCRHYRRGISGGLGLCGLDPRHAAVADTDVMACWVGAPGPTDEAVSATARGAPVDTRLGSAGARAPRTFVPVEELVAAREHTTVAVMERTDPQPAAVEMATAEPVPGPVTAAAPRPDRPVPGRWWLWGDPDPWPERAGGRWT
jgi:hypothetical protein